MAWWDQIGKGIRVERAISPLPQTKTESLFTVSGGKVLLTQIEGEVTTNIEAAANATKLLHTPAVGTAIDICATLDIGTLAFLKGDIMSITGVFANPMGPAASGGAAQGISNPVVLKAGNLGINCAASKTGNIKWTMHYVPLDDGATVVAAPAFP